MGPIKSIRDFFQRRRNAYRALFMADGELNGAAITVMADLRQFCRATSTPAVVSQGTGVIDPIATGIAIGRLEVWHRIAQNIHLSDEDLYRLVDQNQGTE